MAKAIILTTFTDKIGGAERRFARTFLYLSKEKKNFFLFLPIKCYEGLLSQGIRVDKDSNVVPINIRFGSIRMLEFFSRLVGLSVKHRINFAHFFGPSVYSFLFAKFTPFSTSLSVLNSSKTKNSDFTLKEKIIWKLAIKNAKNVDFLSNSIRDNVADLFYHGKNFDNWFVSPCSFTDMSKIITSSHKRDIDVTFLARLEKAKGLGLLFQAIDMFNIAYKDAYKVKFMICGAGSLKEWVMEEISKRPNNEIRLEWTDNPFAMLSRTKIFLSLQKYENYPSQSLMEAMASRCAVIATNVGETYRLINNQCGVKIPENADCLSQALIDLLSDEVRLANMGENACQFIVEYHSIDKFSNYINNCIFGQN